MTFVVRRGEDEDPQVELDRQALEEGRDHADFFVVADVYAPREVEALEVVDEDDSEALSGGNGKGHVRIARRSVAGGEKWPGFRASAARMCWVWIGEERLPV